MSKLLPMIIVTGNSNAMYSSIMINMFTRSMEITEPDWDKDKKNQQAFIVMIFLGIGEMVGPVIMGYITDKFSNRVSLSFLSLSVCAAIGDIIYYNELNEFN